MSPISRPPRPLAAWNLWIIHGAFMTSVPIYAVVAAVLQRAPAESAPERSASPAAFVAVLVVSLAQVLLAHWIPALLESIEGRAGEGAAPGSPPAAPAPADISRRVRPLVVMDALMEAAAVYGLFGVMIGFLEAWQAWVVMGLALLGLVAAVPRVRAWTRGAPPA